MSQMKLIAAKKVDAPLKASSYTSFDARTTTGSF
jgi:hypothetical protein